MQSCSRYRRPQIFAPPVKNVFVPAALLALAFTSIIFSAAKAEDPIVTGYVERVWFDDNRVALRAKLDTGAKTSSINSPEYEIFKKKGKEWVRFNVRNNKGEEFSVKRRLVRYVRIRRAGLKLAERPVIKMKICVGGKTGISEFTLADRSSMNYQVIIGRTFMANRILVDSSRAFLASKKCKQDK